MYRMYNEFYQPLRRDSVILHVLVVCHDFHSPYGTKQCFGVVWFWNSTLKIKVGECMKNEWNFSRHFLLSWKKSLFLFIVQTKKMMKNPSISTVYSKRGKMTFHWKKKSSSFIKNINNSRKMIGKDWKNGCCHNNR